MSNLALVLPLLIATVLSAPTADDLLITLPDGQIRGVEFITGNNKSYYGFQGIPFATPPLGDLRFEAPILPQPWSEILDGAKEASACPSALHFGTAEETSEDCLYINVYTPSLKPTEKLPVMFWIYGGGFEGGSSAKAMYGPDFLIEEDVIVVSHNYRVGAFGFLSTQDEAIRGNAGLKDTNLALKWTHDNIALFGGDPDKVTIFGQSAGGQSTGLQLLSKQSAGSYYLWAIEQLEIIDIKIGLLSEPGLSKMLQVREILSEGLFRAAIVQSGSALTNSSVTINQRAYAFQLASYFSDGDYGNDTQKLKKFLQQKTTEEINDAAMSLTGEDIHAWPTMEVEDEGAFLTESPYVLLESGNFNKVPTMIGICAEESLMFITDVSVAQELALMLDTDSKKVIPVDLRPDPKDEEAAIKKIKSIYLKENETFSDNLVNVAEFISDNKFARALIKHAELQSTYVPVYLYQFAYYGRASIQPFIDGVEKASHGAELPFLFNSTRKLISSDADDLVTQNRVVKLWANFAKYLNPTPEETELFGNVLWPTINPTNLRYLNLNNTIEIRQGLKAAIYQAWNETYYSYGKKPFITF